MPVPTPIELARLHEKDIVDATAKLKVERRCVEQLLIGRTAYRNTDPNRTRLIISQIQLAPYGTVMVYGKKRRDSRKDHLIGPLNAVGLFA